MEYKVVPTWCDCSLNSVAKVAILTIGVNKTWRKVPFKQLCGHAKWRHLQNPKITEGFIHWAKGNDVLSMNVEIEVITESRAPLPHDCLSIRHGSEDYHMSTGRHLSAMIFCGDFEWEVWEMKPESGEWRKLVNKIDLKAHKFKIREFTCEIIRPVCWVTHPHVLSLSGYGKSSCIFYNLDMDEIEFLELSDLDDIHAIVLHRNSLAWFG